MDSPSPKSVSIPAPTRKRKSADAQVSRDTKMLDAALEYAKRGWPVFPCWPGAKEPLISKEQGGHGAHDATTDPKQIREWWTANPNANIGCHVGAAGMMVVDLDPAHSLDRPELDKALKRCRVHKATLIVAKVDRLTRSMSFLQMLLDANVPVVFCDLPSQQGAIGRFMLQQMVAVAELEAGLISERTKAALAAKVERDGQWDRKSKHHLVPGSGQKAAVIAEQARARDFANDTMETIESIRQQGITTAYGIARALNDQGITTPRGGQWQAVQVQRVIDRQG